MQSTCADEDVEPCGTIHVEVGSVEPTAEDLQTLVSSATRQISKAKAAFVLVVDVSGMVDFPSMAFIRDVVLLFRNNEDFLTDFFLGTVWRLPNAEAVPALEAILYTLYEVKRPILMCGPAEHMKERAFMRGLTQR